MELSELKAALQRIEQITNAQWMDGLEERKKAELAFHDLDRDRKRIETLSEDEYGKSYGNRKFYGGTGLSAAYVHAWIERYAKDRIFLDYACGNGGSALEAAQAGARLAIGIDLSAVSIENAKRSAGQMGLGDRTYFLQADAENSHLPDRSVDTVVCSGMLHHLDLSYAFPELRRILAPGGRILAVEALNYNPAIKLYRALTPAMRTEWEAGHILDLADVDFARRFFELGELRYWHITSVLYPYARFMLPVFNAVDRVLTKIPGIRLLAWQFTFELIKKGE
jgi:SAM-dependent methyltransferase